MRRTITPALSYTIVFLTGLLLAGPTMVQAAEYTPLAGLSAKDRVMLAASMAEQGQCHNAMIEVTEAAKDLREDETLLRLKGFCESELGQPAAKDTIMKWLKLAPQNHPDRSKMLAILAKAQAPQETAMEWVTVPAGEFEMGAEGGGAEPDEAPKHKVFLDAFLIGKHEATNGQYHTFVKATGHRPPQHEDPKFSLWRGTTMLDGVTDLPVINVNWEDAAAFCKWVGGRLPTEAEWEKAARGTDGRTFPWGNDPVTGNRTNYSIENVTFWEGASTLAKVHQYDFGRSPYGVYEMAGNVWEWVQDWYQADYYKQSPPKNPTGPADGKERVLRGGSWRENADHLRSANRFKMFPTEGRVFAGIRCAKDTHDAK